MPSWNSNRIFDRPANGREISSSVFGLTRRTRLYLFRYGGQRSTSYLKLVMGTMGSCYARILFGVRNSDIEGKNPIHNHESCAENHPRCVILHLLCILSLTQSAIIVIHTVISHTAFAFEWRYHWYHNHISLYVWDQSCQLFLAAWGHWLF